MDNLRSLPAFLDAERICADASIFYRTQAQSEGGFKTCTTKLGCRGYFSQAGSEGISDDAGFGRQN